MQKITTFLAFNDQAEEAVAFYRSVFLDLKVEGDVPYREGEPGPAGKTMVVNFELFGQQFIALNGGEYFKFSNGISLLINCETQEEVDTYWEKLSEGGKKIQCGWLEDKFGISWQVVPNLLGKLMSDPDVEKQTRVMQAMMQMQKLDMGELQKKAYDGV